MVFPPCGALSLLQPTGHQHHHMDWVLSFERARNVYDKLLVDEIWTNAAAMKEIAQWLDRKKCLQKGSVMIY
jgi:hypothetical protein